jgi:hypothetical protein
VTDGEQYVDKLIAALRHFEPTRAGLAVYILSEMLHEPRAVAPLIDLLDTARDTFVLKSAAVALGRFADERAVPALARRALDLSTPLVVRVAAVDALARVGGDQVRAVIEGALADPSRTVRDHAKRALGYGHPADEACGAAATEPAPRMIEHNSRRS